MELLELKETLSLLMSACRLKFESAVDHFGKQQTYAFRCVQSEYAMRYSEPFLEGCLKNSQRNGDVYWERYFDKHLLEERGHHSWAKSDLELINSIATHSWTVSLELKQLISWQWERIKAGEVLSQVGYCICVESYQGSRQYWEEYCRDSGLPRECFKNVLNHSVIDLEHAAELWEIYRLLDRRERTKVADSAIATAVSQLEMFRSLSANIASVFSAQKTNSASP
jgi:hypothetical protein